MVVYLEWIAVAVVIVGSALAASDIYPAGAITLNFGTLLWLIVAIMWKSRSLIVVNAVVLSVYTTGLLIKWMS